MRMCVELGLHRKRKSAKLSLQSELKKRLFWSCYAYDRELAIVMGRPLSISDHDIDVDVRIQWSDLSEVDTKIFSQLPLDVDEANQDVEKLRKAATENLSMPKYPQTTMTCFIHLLRLKRLESEIQHKVYRVDTTKSVEAIEKTTDTFLNQLREWKDAIPPQSTEWDPKDRQTFRGDVRLS
jgi:hypothetical protein